MSVNLCRFAKNVFKILNYRRLACLYCKILRKKTTVLERHETVKTGENMAESAYFFVTLQQNCNV